MASVMLPPPRIEPLETRIAPAGVALIDATLLDGATGFIIPGANAGDFFGFDVSPAGDMNGDGIDDFLIGGGPANTNTSVQKSSYVIFGTESGFPASLSLNSLEGSNGFRIVSSVAGTRLGGEVASLGDVNNDGFDDIAITQGRVTQEVRIADNAVHVIFGKASAFPATFDVRNLNGSNGFTVPIQPGGYLLETSVGRGGDVNGDGIDDFVIGSANNNSAYVVFGRTTPFAAQLDVTSLSGSNGFRITGGSEFDEWIGHSVAVAGDINNDGFKDILLGAPNAAGSDYHAGRAYVVFGAGTQLSASFNLSTLNGVNGFSVSGTSAHGKLGATATGAGDVNGDGFDDIILGTANYADGNGAVIFGKANGFVRDISLHTLDGSNGFTVPFPSEKVAGVGDINGDGYDDFAFGTYQTFVAYGKSNGFTPSLSMAELYNPDGTSGFRVIGSIIAVNDGPADVNGDGYPDLLLAAPSATPEGKINAGAVYVIYGFGPSLSVSDPSVSEGDTGTKVVTFTVTLSTPSLRPISVLASTANGGAISGEDFETISPILLNFEPGETTKTVSVNVVGETFYEASETFFLNLSQPLNASLFKAQGTATIINDDTLPRFSLSDLVLNEGAPGESRTANFIVSLSNPSQSVITLNYGIQTSTAESGADFEFHDDHGAVVFQPGETSKTIGIQIIGDNIYETNEFLEIAAVALKQQALAVDPIGRLSIVDDDPLPSISIADLMTAEFGRGVVTKYLPVVLSNPSAFPITFSYRSVDGTANAPFDYLPILPQTMVIPAGVTDSTIAVHIVGDWDAEANRDFIVQLFEPVSASLADAEGQVRILDDDVVLLGQRKVTFTEPDGDRVVVTTSKGSFLPSDFLLAPEGDQGGALLALLDLHGRPEFQGATLKISAHQSGSGDGTASIGRIDASGVDLRSVVADGTLEGINAGDTVSRTPALRVLKLEALGSGTDTRVEESLLVGGAGKVIIRSNVWFSLLTATGDGAKFGTISMKGSLLHSSILAEGFSQPSSAAQQNVLRSLKIAGDAVESSILAGYNTPDSGINGDVSIGRVQVGGSWNRTDLAIGLGAGVDSVFGTEDDAVLPGSDDLIASIARISIRGGMNAEPFGGRSVIAGEQIVSLMVGGKKIALVSGPHNDSRTSTSGADAELLIREVHRKTEQGQ